MTVTTEAPVVLPADEVRAEPVTLGRAVRSEWIKFRTLRSSWIVLGVAMLAMVVFGLLVAYNTRHLSPKLQANDTDASGPLQGYYLGQLLIGSLGVLFVSGEFGTGMIRSTFAAVPRRLPVLWAKLVVFVGVVAATMIPVSVVAFVVAQGLISNYRTGFSLSAPGALRVAIGTGVYLTLLGVLGGAIGWIVRNTPGSLVTYFAVILVLPVLFGDALGSWGKDVAQYLPASAGGSFITIIPDGTPSLSPWVGLVVLVAWVVAAVVVAVVTLRRRDV